MTIQDNKAIAKRFIEGLGSCNVDELELTLNDTAIFWIMARSEGLPLPRRMTKTELCSNTRRMADILPNGISHKITGMIGEGDHVAVETECYAELPGGKKYNNLFHFFITIRDGKVETIREYTDLLHTKQALFPDPE